MVRLDMSEYMERHTVSSPDRLASRLCGPRGGRPADGKGAPPSLRDSGAVRRIEKAQRTSGICCCRSWTDGELTDSQGRRVDFRNTIIVMTSNVAPRTSWPQGQRLGFAAGEDDVEKKEEQSFEAVREAVMGELSAPSARSSSTDRRDHHLPSAERGKHRGHCRKAAGQHSQAPGRSWA